MMLPAAAFAQEAAPAAPAPAEAVAADAGASAPAPAVVELKPTQGIGMPVPEAIELQEQFTDVGNYGRWMHDTVLMPIITIICLFVLALLLWVVVRYRASANPTPSRRSEEHTSELQSLMRISYAVFRLKKKTIFSQRQRAESHT